MLENNPGCEVSMREEYCIGLPSTMTKILPVGISAKCWLLLEVVNSSRKCHVASAMFVQIWTGLYCTHQENPKKIIIILMHLMKYIKWKLR
jgi:hypothetical protein